MITTIPGPICKPSDFPEPSQFPDELDGLVAYGHLLNEDLLLAAYRQGIFPWYSEGEPVLWWSPVTRCILRPQAFKCHRSLRKILKKGHFQVTMNTACQEVIRSCASIPRKDQAGTWITPEMQETYASLHRLGHVHSVEVWENGELVGGLYGVRVGSMFCGESMFSRATNASKVALATLVSVARDLNIDCIDCQVPSNHLLHLGAETLPRAEFLTILKHSLASHTSPPWPSGTLAPKQRATNDDYDP